MDFLIIGFLTSLSLILAIGAQNVFVIEQGLKKQHIFLVCLVCSISDFVLIFSGIFLFHFFNQYFNVWIELLFNILLLIFISHFILSKIKAHSQIVNFNTQTIHASKLEIFLKYFFLINKRLKSFSGL